VGECAVEIVQAAAVAIAGGLRVDDLAKVPLSFPTYAEILGRAAFRAAQQINPEFGGPIQSSALPVANWPYRYL
jgi:3-keto-L-gulonate-6-phosphate decarboxylase